MIAQINNEYIRRRPSRLWPRMLAYTLFEGRPLTTRGRWMNPLVFALAAVVKRMPQMRQVKSPAFILGTGRSGTTILGVVLSMHPDVGFLNEPKAIWAGLYPGEDLIGSYNRNSARYRLGVGDATPLIRRRASRVFGSYLWLSGACRIVDKYPEMIFRTKFLRALFPDARFLFLSRNGVATCGSIRNWSQRLGTEVAGETHDWWGADDRKWRLLVEQLVPDHPDLAAHSGKMNALNHEGRAAVEWIITMREGMRLLEVDPNGTLHVPYEALCADPRGWSERLQAFLDLSRDAVFEEYAAATLVDPMREIHLDLPDWLAPIFEETENSLRSQRCHGTSTTIGKPT